MAFHQIPSYDTILFDSERRFPYVRGQFHREFQTPAFLLELEDVLQALLHF